MCFLGGWGLFTSEFVGGGGSIVPLGHRSAGGRSGRVLGVRIPPPPPHFWGTPKLHKEGEKKRCTCARVNTQHFST